VNDAELMERALAQARPGFVTRCGGITGLLSAFGLANAHSIDVSAHCAPAISTHAFCAVERRRHLEYFHDHVRIEAMVFDGVPEPAIPAND